MYKNEHTIYFEVVDDGSGMTVEMTRNVLQANKESGYGIRNVHERVQLAYGVHYGVVIFSRLGIGTQVIITIPLGE